MTKTVAVIAAHTDDEALGCGGTIARHAAAGDEVYGIFLADGVTSRKGVGSDEFAERQRAAAAAHQLLSFSGSHFLAMPDNRLDSISLLDIVQKLEELLREIKPQIVYTHHAGDLNVDHRITHQAVMTACRPLPGCATKEIYAFEVLSSSEWGAPGAEAFLPQHFVDITDFLEVKLAALDAYRLEMRAAPHSRSLEHVRALATHRGHSVGVTAAEAFMVLRVVR